MSQSRKHEWVYPGGMPGHVVGGIWRPSVRECGHCLAREDRKAATQPCPGQEVARPDTATLLGSLDLGARSVDDVVAEIRGDA